LLKIEKRRENLVKIEKYDNLVQIEKKYENLVKNKDNRSFTSCFM